MKSPRRIQLGLAIVLAGIAIALAATAQEKDAPPDYVLNDSHFHLTNYVQEGTDIRDFLGIMGDKVGRAALFGLPLQQMWSHGNTGDFAPTYYLETDAPLYYYSFTDAFIARAYQSLTPEQQKRIDPMVTGFNPADMYAADHIRRVLETFPGVFCGIGEFTIHKEFVSGKIAGPKPSLIDPALDRVFSFAGEVGLLVLLHNDLHTPFPKPGRDTHQAKQLWDLLQRHPEATIIWAHCGLGRVVNPIEHQLEYIDRMLSDPKMSHVYIDVSWMELAKYIMKSETSVARSAELLEKHPDRFLFGTDEVAPKTQESYLKIYEAYLPLLEKLTPETRHALLKGNHERLFDAAIRKVRAWEAENVGK